MRIRNRRSRALCTVVATSLLALGGPLLSASAAGGPNIAVGDPTAASSSHGEYGAANITDGDQGSYWQSDGGSLPQWVQTDLGATERIDEVVLRLPAGWESRDQTLSVQGSADGTSFSTLKSSATYAFEPGSGNTVTVSFPAARTRFVRVDVTANTGWRAAQLSELEVHAAGESSTNLAAGRRLTAGSSAGAYSPANGNDGNKATYWESANNDLPQWLQADLGSSRRIDRVVLRLPDGWPARSQTLKIQSSDNGSDLTDLTTAEAHTFDGAGGQSATITFDATTARYVRVLVTANTGQPAAQVSELEVYGPATGDTQAPTAPANLALTEPATGQVRLTWNEATDDTAVTGYDIYANGDLLTTVAGDVTTYTDTRPADATVTYHVRAKDAAGNQSGNSNPVTRRADTGDTQAPTAPANLALTEPAAGRIKLTWTASTDDTAVTGYDIYADNKLRKSVAGDVTTYTDTQPASANVTYHVRAKDAAGNQSGTSNAVTRTGSGGGSNLAVGKPISASSFIHTYAARNANDNSTSTYWEGAAGSYPNTLTLELGADADVDGVVLKLNPDTGWSKRTQNIQVLGREQDASGFTTLVAAKDYVFDPASGGNSVTVPVDDRVADVQLRFTSNTGATAGQIAEFQVIGAPAPNPDLEVTKLTNSPASPVESDGITVSATVRNSGPANAPAGTVALRLGDTEVATAEVGALEAGAQSTVSASIGAREAGSYELSAVADEANEITERNETNNTYTRPEPLVVKPVQSSDLVAATVTTSPSSPAAGDDVTFKAALKNQGTQDSAGGGHAVTLTLVDSKGITVETLTGAHSGIIAAGTTAPAVSLGTWKAANGSYTLKVTVADDANELPVKRENNTSTQPLFVGRGADMPYDMYEAEDGTVGGGGADMENNLYENLSSTLTWRAAGLAVYGGYNNTFRNIHIADTLVYSGITISSLDFGYPMNGFGTDPTNFENISIVRAGGHFWGNQTFPGIWVFSASKVFQGIRVSDVDIVDPTYSGIMFQTNYVGGQPQFPIKDTVFTDVTISGARESGDAFDAKSGFGLWANEMPEANQGPAVGEVVFNGLKFSDNAVDIRNTTSTFKIIRNP
ncbi:discoidin domain-containing protein [Streptomyces sp. NPDC000351]|uniref:discoidin domain-containing protein n=1 Tax=Streptomyces sp. NPDC000351 TaxID=3154250 RepID=UPI00331C175C